MLQADESWSDSSGCRHSHIWPNDKTCYKGTSACFIFGLGAGDDARHDPGTARYGPKQRSPPGPTSTNYQLARTTDWPTWGYGSVPDLSMGNNGPPGANAAGCMVGARGGGVFAGAPNEPSGVQGPPICGSINLGVWGETQLEVWRMATPEELDAALQI